MTSKRQKRIRTETRKGDVIQLRDVDKYHEYAVEARMILEHAGSLPDERTPYLAKSLAMLAEKLDLPIPLKPNINKMWVTSMEFQHSYDEVLNNLGECIAKASILRDQLLGRIGSYAGKELDLDKYTEWTREALSILEDPLTSIERRVPLLAKMLAPLADQLDLPRPIEPMNHEFTVQWLMFKSDKEFGDILSHLRNCISMAEFLKSQHNQDTSKIGDPRTERRRSREGRIAHILKERPDIEQAELAEIIGRSPATISRSEAWKLHKSRFPRGALPRSVVRQSDLDS